MGIELTAFPHCVTLYSTFIFQSHNHIFKPHAPHIGLVLVMTPMPAPNDDVSVNVSYTANGNAKENPIAVDAVCEKEYI